MTRRLCERLGEKWLGRLDGVWTAVEEAKYRAHLASCDSCRAAVEEERRVVAVLAREKAAPVSAASLRFLDHLATRVMAEARAAARGDGAGWRVAWRRLVFVGATAIAGVFLAYAAMTVRDRGAVEEGRLGDGMGDPLEVMADALGELEAEELPEVESLASGATTVGASFELSMGRMNREELKLLDEKLQLELPADFSEIEAATIAGAGGEGPLDDALDDLTEAELRDVGEQIGREFSPASRERRGG